MQEDFLKRIDWLTRLAGQLASLLAGLAGAGLLDGRTPYMYSIRTTAVRIEYKYGVRPPYAEPLSK